MADEPCKLCTLVRVALDLEQLLCSNTHPIADCECKFVVVESGGLHLRLRLNEISCSFGFGGKHSLPHLYWTIVHNAINSLIEITTRFL